MDTLRWILLIVGVLVIAGLYGYYRWQEGTWTPPWLRDRRGGGEGPSSSRRRRERDVDVALKDLDDMVIDDPDAGDGVDLDMDISATDDGPFPVDWDDPDQTVSTPRVRPTAGRAREQSQGARAEETPREKPAPPAEPRGRRGGRHSRKPAPVEALESDPAWQDAGEKLIVLHVTAGKGYVFTGPPLIDALERVGLEHGMHAIYHRMVDAQSGPTPMFSVANMVEPGTFRPEEADQLETPGVALFLQLPGPFDGLTAFEQMLEAARRLADQLGGQLLDRQRCDLTTQAIEHIREDLREYRRLAHLAARRGG